MLTSLRNMYIGGRCPLRMMSTTNLRKIDVTVNEGTVVGREEVLPNGNSYFTFKGIPYAEAPVGKLRFQDAVRISKFSEPILDCSKERDGSYHKDLLSGKFTGSENCLHLNIFSPVSGNDATNGKPLPVMIWIHGGAFMSGSGSSDYYSPEYLVQNNVIVVTINYRLGALGFLSLPDAGVPGNAGLKDQLSALKWVSENISNFGGDPNNITLFGSSAGGASIHIHLVSPESKKYFHKAICQSGTSVSAWAIHRKAVNTSMKLAERLGYMGSSQVEAFEYMQTITELPRFSQQITSVLCDDERRRGLPMPYKPCVEADSANALITKHPYDLMHEPNQFDKPVMMGYNVAEGHIVTFDMYKKLAMYDKDLGRMIPRTLKLPNERGDEPESIQLTKEVRDFYFNGQSLTEESLQSMSNLHTDSHFIVSNHMAAELHARNQPQSPLYFYRFSYDGEFNMFKKLMQKTLNLDYLWKLKGACHGDEMFYLFNLKALRMKRDETLPGTKVADNMSKMWTNFAKYGNPTPSDDESLPVKWNPVKPVGDGEKFALDYLEIDKNLKMDTDPDKDRIDFWRSAYQKWNGGLTKPYLG